MIALWLKANWKWLAVLAVVAAILGYGYWKYREGKNEGKTEAKIEKLEDNAKAATQDTATRKKQNEVLVRDITPSVLDNILLDGAF